jgi:hypothetical protein
MSRIGAAFLTALMLAASPPVPLAAAAEAAPHKITRDTAWGCRDKGDVINLLFLGISAGFDTQLASALADGRCITFKPGEDVVIVEPGANGLVKVQRPGASPAAYWTVSRNVN